jgi:hypothetical protein
MAAMAPRVVSSPNQALGWGVSTINTSMLELDGFGEPFQAAGKRVFQQSRLLKDLKISLFVVNTCYVSRRTLGCHIRQLVRFHPREPGA